MCGIAGYFSLNETNHESLIKSFGDSLNHRGPDHCGYHNSLRGFILNTRLSIIDLENGNQPFFSADRSIAVVQNGEIYNFIEVRNDLSRKGVEFKTSSDTEVILRAYEYYGENFISHLNGMFAIAIYDEKKQNVYLYRDRLGVKPLFFFKENENFAFSSEVKSFLKLPGFKKTIDDSALYHYLNFNYVPAPLTIFKDVRHVTPGSRLTWDLRSNQMSEHKYWDLSDTQETARKESDLLDEIESLIEDAVNIRLRSDVPIGAFLSGGLDSSLVCAIAKKKFKYSFETYTIGFRETQFDESPFARQVADFLDLKNEIAIMGEDKVDLWTRVCWFNDQPHGDISFIPTYLVSQKAAEKYKVVFSGDGGDEAFGGYLKYLELLEMDASSREFFRKISLFDETSSDFNNLLSSEFRSRVSTVSSYELFKETMSSFGNKDSINRGILFDVKNLLPGNNLVKPDRMAMAHSLEVRSPLLDYRIFETMFALPGNLKISHELGTKHLLKKLALRYLPEDLVYRKKQMFTVPVGEWFKTSRAQWLKNHLLDEKFLSAGYFERKSISRMLDEHISGSRNHTRELRALAAFKLWMDEFITGEK